MAISAEIQVEWLEEVDSTNLVARRWIEGEARGEATRRVFVARRQTAGVGRHGRRWLSPEGGLWCSLAWGLGRESGSAMDALGLRVGIACWRCVRAFCERGEVRLKWPNDVLIDGRKVCGCLVESFTHAGQMWLVVGVGINVANRAGELPEGLRTPPTSINELRRVALRPQQMVEGLVNHLAEAITVVPGERAAWFAEAGRSLHGVGSPVRVLDSLDESRGYRAMLSGLSHDGRLLVRRGAASDPEVVLPVGTAIEYVQALSGPNAGGQ